jgi:hypothetical protein
MNKNKNKKIGGHYLMPTKSSETSVEATGLSREKREAIL